MRQHSNFDDGIRNNDLVLAVQGDISPIRSVWSVKIPDRLFVERVRPEALFGVAAQVLQVLKKQVGVGGSEAAEEDWRWFAARCFGSIGSKMFHAEGGFQFPKCSLESRL